MTQRSLNRLAAGSRRSRICIRGQTSQLCTVLASPRCFAIAIRPLFRPSQTVLVLQVFNVPEEFPTICAAISAANWGDRILVSPGVYSETLAIFKALEIVGTGDDRQQTVIRSTGKTAVTVESTTTQNPVTLKLKNLSIRVQLARGKFDHAIDNEGGVVEMEGCILEGGYWGLLNTAAGLSVLLDCDIRRCSGYGIFNADQSSLWMFRNRVYGHELSGINIQSKGSTAKLIENEVTSCKANGVMACAGAEILLLQNKITGNGDAGISLCDPGTMGVVRKNVVSGCGLVGIYIFDSASGVVEANDLRDNGHLPLSVQKDSVGKVICTGNAA
mmetsp:Transcript_12174/g.19096  ORF Transcript_12174/g.19096 Transcript_12174/m.19096 type:complete len:330 (+) Transcript_12174:496-1485(+)